MEIFSQTVGWIGTLLVVLAYYLVSTKKIDAGSRSYQYLNFFGAIGIGINVFYQSAWPAFVLQITWAIIAVVSLLKGKIKINMKINKKVLLGIIVILLIVIIFLVIKQNPDIKINKIAETKVSNNSEVIPGTNIIQARLVGIDGPNYDPLLKFYVGNLTFQNLIDNEKHVFVACGEDWFIVKQNEIYDLPANYYIVSDPANGSMRSPNCDGPLHLSNK